jgi:hypothetical protein
MPKRLYLRRVGEPGVVTNICGERTIGTTRVVPSTTTAVRTSAVTSVLKMVIRGLLLSESHGVVIGVSMIVIPICSGTDSRSTRTITVTSTPVVATNTQVTSSTSSTFCTEVGKAYANNVRSATINSITTTITERTTTSGKLVPHTTVSCTDPVVISRSYVNRLSSICAAKSRFASITTVTLPTT